ncbi:MAG: ATP-binding protein [Phormidesmis sp.]
MKHLLLIADDEGRRTIELQTSSSSIGRDARNSIVLNSPEISRQHAVLLRLPSSVDDEHRFRIIDGNFQGKPSTNGLLINGVPKFSHDLCHGDAIVFAASVDAHYFAVEDSSDTAWLFSGEDAAALDYMKTCAVQRPLAMEERAVDDGMNEASLERLASFPELFPHPIIEISLAGELTYLNPAALKQFPALQTSKLAHPLLEGVIELVKADQQRQSTRQVKIGDRTFEEALNYIAQSDLVRIYLLDITSRRQAEEVMKALHRKLEIEFENRTRQFNDATTRLKREEKALLASHATNRALLNALPDPMFRIDANGQFVNIKIPKQHTLPFDPELCLNKMLADIWPLNVAQLMQNGIQQALVSTEIQVLDLQFPDTNVHFEARIAVSAQDEVMVIFRDITERKQSEADIRGALERQRELNEMKTQFVSMTSHEFRTPLTTILSSAELLEHYSEQWEKEKQLQYLQKIKVATKHMIELLNDVLLINKTEAGRLEFNPQPLVLNDFCKEVIEAIQVTTDTHTIQMHSQLCNAPMQLDRKLMRHILTNLLTNAVNYSPHGGEILLTVTHQNQEITLVVEDYGIGIPEESQATLFDSFVRGSNVGRISGTGLGLAIVKKSVDLHRGRIDCRSKVGEGTTFVVDLPLITS